MMSSQSLLYFAYGSNMKRRWMAQLCPGATPIGRATAHDYRLTFPAISVDCGGGVASIDPSPGDFVEGALYEIAPHHLTALDDYEGVAAGLYTRGALSVVNPAGQTLDVMTYFATHDPRGPFAPSRKYMAIILEGARDHDLPTAWVEYLQSL